MSAERILVVDDDVSTRNLLKEHLSNLGYEVTSASNGEEALEKYVPEMFDCIISDLFMPKIDGMELLKKIRQIDREVFFLMITGYPSIDGAVNAIKEGAYDYVTKPFQLEDFRVKVERALSAKRMRKSFKTTKGLLWGFILSIPLWLILGIILGIVWK